MGKYNYLKKQYPKYVTKEQLRVIAHIRKSYAKWLLDTGFIPCENSGKKTRQYKIALIDIIRFLDRRDKEAIPRPTDVARKAEKKNAPIEKYSKAFAKYLLRDLPDAFPIKSFCQYSHISEVAIRARISKGQIESVFINARYYILKTVAVSYLSSDEYAKYLRYTRRDDIVQKLYKQWKKR